MKGDYFDSDEFKELLNSYEESIEQGYPSYLDEDDYADISDYYMNKGNAELAMECAEYGLDNHPDSLLMQSVKSGLLIFFHRYEEAKEILDAVPDDKINLDMFYQRAQLEYALYGNIDTAEELFREWIELTKEDGKKNRENNDSYIRDSYIHVITSLVELTENRNYDEELVKRWIEEYLVIFQPIGVCNSDIVLSEIVREENLYDMVEKVYIKLLENDPYSPGGYTILATAQNSLGKIQDSIESCNFALAIDAKDWEAKAILAHDLFICGDYEQALTTIEEVVVELGDHSQSLLYSKCLCMCNRDEECCEQLKNTEEFAQTTFKDRIPDLYAEIYCEVAELYMMCNKDEDAINAIDKSLSIYPEDSHYLNEKGIILAHKGEDENLVNKYLLKSISLTDSNIEGFLNTGMRLLFSNSTKLALDYLSTANSYEAITDEDKYFKRVIPGYLALIYFKTKKLDKFLPCIKEACENCPDVVENLFKQQIPETVAPEDFYYYILRKLDSLQNEKEREEDNSESTDEDSSL